ncbi:YhhA family cyclophane-containing RiPP [uncultured Enterovirga sp.]|uniref:YhhA family cyclophane-containing RiPP n=1 Tax=uncultured Enterovirga sp. TaxID=2026352 RepID=UPI0035CB83D5
MDNYDGPALAHSVEDVGDVEIDAFDVPLDSPALARLIEEVREEGAEVSRSYNRTYNRHNR